jgi:hypothetical protein
MVDSDDEHILSSKSISNNDKESLMKARMGQTGEKYGFNHEKADINMLKLKEIARKKKKIQ